MARILVVDDASFMRMRCAKLLRENGHEVFEAENGAEAISKYKEIQPSLVLMDITMPVMDGITAVREIISEDRNAKIVMVSALGQQAMVIDAIRAGAKDFILKPFQPERILEAVAKFAG